MEIRLTMRSKKAILHMHWAELLAGALLILGFAFQISTIGSTALSYIVLFLWVKYGAFGGYRKRLYFSGRSEERCIREEIK